MKLLSLIAVAVVLWMVTPIASYADSSSTATAVPSVTLPYTFVCPHCGMKITIKTKDDWTKSCVPCPCGTNNLGCYKALKKH